MAALRLTGPVRSREQLGELTLPVLASGQSAWLVLRGVRKLSEAVVITPRLSALGQRLELLPIYTVADDTGQRFDARSAATAAVLRLLAAGAARAEVDFTIADHSGGERRDIALDVVELLLTTD